MKRKIITIGMIILLIVTNAIVAYASTETTVTLQSSKEEVEIGETFTVTVKATCPDGINGIDTTYSYESEKLELVSENVSNANFVNIGVDNSITVICNSTETIDSSDIYTLTFKVKEGAEIGTTAKISLAETLLDSDAATDSEYIIAAQEIEVTLIEKTVGSDNEEQNSTSGEDNEEQNSTSGEENQAQTTSTEEKDETIADKDIPKAGLNTKLVLTIVVVGIIAIIIYRKNEIYRDIR